MKYFSSQHNFSKNLRPPDLYEYFVDNYWFRSANFDEWKIDEPLRGSHKADIVIVGGGYTGLSTAYHLKKKFPEKRIVLLEGARCGYGASGRNGGFCVATALVDWDQKDADALEKSKEVSFYGLEFIKKMISEHGVDCDLNEKGLIEMAISEHHIKRLEEYQAELRMVGLDSTIIENDELEKEFRSPVFLAGLKIPYGATLNPAKLVREMKRVVEEIGVEIFERTVVTRITPGKVNQIDTELGDVQAPVLVVAVNAYANKLGFFKDRVFPVSVYQIATEPLNQKQWDAIGWGGRQGLSDMRALYSYSVRTADDRIVMGGSDFIYYDFDKLSSGNDKAVTQRVTNNLFRFFPQLEGLKIDHAWGGTTSYTLGRIPSVGVMGDHENIYFGTGFRNGVPAAQAAGRMIADLMAGESNAFTEHFIVNRKIPYAGPKSLRGLFGRAIRWMMKTFDYSPIQ